MKMIKKIILCPLVGIVCLITGCMTLQPSCLEPGLYKLQLFFSSDTTESELKKVFGETLIQIKGSMISRAASSMPGEEGEKWRNIMAKARRNNDFQSIISAPIASLPLNLWDDFPVYLSKSQNIMEFPHSNFRGPYMFDGHLLKVRCSLTPMVAIELQGKTKDNNTITGTFTMEWYNRKTRSIEQCQTHGTFIIQRTGPIPDNEKPQGQF